MSVQIIWIFCLIQNTLVDIKNQENHGMFIYTDNWFWFNGWFIYGV